MDLSYYVGQEFEDQDTHKVYLITGIDQSSVETVWMCDMVGHVFNGYCVGGTWNALGQVTLYLEEKTEDTEVYIDRETAMMYCAGSEEMFHEFLGMFCKLRDSKLEKILKCYQEEDWNGYGIELHALKSTSLSIGGKRLSELALELEKAGKSGDAEFILAHHEEVLKLYEATVQEGMKILEKV